MTSTTLPARATARTLDRAVAAQAARRRADVDLLDAALDWAHAHTVPTDGDAAGWPTGGLFGERLLPIAGEGTPLVGEWALVELSGALGISHEAALCLVGDALDLHHRLPRLWALVRDLRVPAHLGRLAAEKSRDLTPAAAAHADRLLVWQPKRLNPHRIGVLVHEARLYADPDRAAADHDEALTARRVDVDHKAGPPGVSEVHMSLDTADALSFDDTLTRLADLMGALGHPGSLDVRRATSVGVLADPQRALDLLVAADIPTSEWDTSEAIAAAEDACHQPATPFTRTPAGTGVGTGAAAGVGAGAGASASSRTSGGPAVTLVLHLTDRDLLTTGPLGTGAVASHDTLGPLAMARLSTWLLGAGQVVVKPVLDPTRIRPVDAHDPPARMAEAVRLRDPVCVYPGCTRPSERADLDHINPYIPLEDGGPPGQTSYEALAPLCRRHHRAKTHGNFTYHRQPDGSYHWRLPTGRRITTDPPVPRPRPHPPSDDG